MSAIRWVEWFDEERIQSELDDLTQSRSRPPTTVTSIRPTRPEKTNPTSTHQSHVVSFLTIGSAWIDHSRESVNCYQAAQSPSKPQPAPEHASR
jgi:hypothetical protein